MNHSIISQIEIAEQGVTVFPGDILANIVRKELSIKYECPGIDLRELDLSVLTVPYILNVAPIIWAMGLKCEVYSMDDVFYERLNVIREGLRELYPHQKWDGEIIPTRLRKNSLCERKRDYKHDQVLFFSGGFDSTYSSLKFDPDRTILLTVRGHDISLSDDPAWNNVISGVEDFAQTLGFSTARVSANIFRFLCYTPIHKRFPELKPWYAFVQHGLSLAGLAFPLASSMGLDSVCFSSSNDEISSHLPWGAHPLLEPQLRVGDIQVRSVGGDKNWIEKLKDIVTFYRKNPDFPKPFLRVCLSEMSGDSSRNCCKCVKCLRRIISLMLFSEDPNEWGFIIPEPVFSKVRKSCLDLKISNTYDTFYWHDMAQIAESFFENENEGYVEFFTWLALWVSETKISEFDKSKETER